MRETIVNAQNISKRFFILRSRPSLRLTIAALLKGKVLRHEFWALKDVSLKITKGSKTALIGKNGSGKTTLLRLLAGIHQVSSGEIQVSETPSILFRLQTGLAYDLPAEENIVLLATIFGTTPAHGLSMVEKVLEFAELQDLRYLPVKDLSSGQAQRLALTVFLFTSSKFVIFDESFTYLDQAFANKCENYLLKNHSLDHTSIFCSHDCDFLRRHCQQGIWIEHGKIRMQGEIENVLSVYEKEAAVIA